MRILKFAVLTVVAALFLGACANNGLYDETPRQPDHPTHRH